VVIAIAVSIALLKKNPISHSRQQGKYQSSLLTSQLQQQFLRRFYKKSQKVEDKRSLFL
jgi:hypothetical protein